MLALLKTEPSRSLLLSRCQAALRQSMQRSCTVPEIRPHLSGFFFRVAVLQAAVAFRQSALGLSWCYSA